MFAKVLVWTLAVPLVGTLAVMCPWRKTDAPCVKMAEALRDHALATGGGNWSDQVIPSNWAEQLSSLGR
jgi:hypothetical protein